MMINIVKQYNMTIYVDEITMDFNTEYRECARCSAERHPSHCERQRVRCKKLRNQICFKRYYISKTSRYLMQCRTPVTCCECLDGMKAYNDKRKRALKT